MVGEGKQVSFDDLYNTSSLAVLQNEAEKRESFQKRFESQTVGVIHLSKFGKVTNFLKKVVNFLFYFLLFVDILIDFLKY